MTPPSKTHRLAVPALAAILCFACSCTRQTTMLVLHDGTRLQGDVLDTRPRDVVFVATRISVPDPTAVRPAASLGAEARRHSPLFVDVRLMNWWIHDVTVHGRRGTSHGVAFDVAPKGIRVPRSNISTTGTSSATPYIILGSVLGGALVIGSALFLLAALNSPRGSIRP